MEDLDYKNTLFRFKESKPKDYRFHLINGGMASVSKEQLAIDPLAAQVKNLKKIKGNEDLGIFMQIKQPHYVVLWFSVFTVTVLQISGEVTEIVALVLVEN